MLTPVSILNKNHMNGWIISEWIKTTSEAKDAKAAKTLIWPTLEIIFGIVEAPMKYPTKYPDIIKPVAVKENSSCTALTPNRDPWKPYAIIIKLIPRKSAQEFFKTLFIKDAVSICDVLLNQVLIVTSLRIFEF